MSAPKHVAVLMGGWSGEREISFLSGNACADALERLGWNVTRIDVGADVAQRLLDLKPDVALNCLHGGPGGDGRIQALMEMLRIPYTHSGVAASVLSTRKDLARIVLANRGVRVPPGIVVSRFEAAQRHMMPAPYVIKPLSEGSSLGVTFVMEGTQGPPANLLEADWMYGDNVLCESYIKGRELSCAVVGDRSLDVIETVLAGRFNDREEKFAVEGSITVAPAEIPQDVYREVQRLTLLAHQALGCRGMSRADFRYDEEVPGTAGIYCLEVNNQPGMTNTSLVPELAALVGIGFDALVMWMVDDASLLRGGEGA